MIERWELEPLPFFAVYRLSGGDVSWAMALSVNKKGSFKCRVVDEVGGRFKKAKQVQVDFTWPHPGAWKVMTLEQLPAGVRDRLVGE